MEYLKGVKDSSKDKRRVGGATAQAGEATLKMTYAWLGEKIILIMLISKRPAENWVSVGRQQW